MSLHYMITDTGAYGGHRPGLARTANAPSSLRCVQQTIGGVHRGPRRHHRSLGSHQAIRKHIHYVVAGNSKKRIM